jgi:predicted RNA-binding Zn ribbon-like protein
VDGYRFVAVGGHVALDLVNTISWRTDPSRCIDRVPDLDGLLAWAHSLDVIAPAGPSAAANRFGEGREAAEAFQRIRDLRSAVADVVEAHIDHVPVPRRPLTVLQRQFATAVRSAAVTSELPLRWAVQPVDLPGLGAHLALEAVDLLQSPRLELARRCDGAGCGWLFLDTTRNHSRRWCDSRDCGNRARVRRHAVIRRAQNTRPQ